MKLETAKRGATGSRVLWVLLGIIGVLVIGALSVGGCVMAGYNQAQTLDVAVGANWAQVENVLQRRYDLIPNLVNTVKGITKQEQAVFLGIQEARAKYFSAGSRDEKIAAAGGVERALSRLLMLQETYPQLKSNESFLKLQDELAGTENRIAVERKRYNDAVQSLNTFCRRFPSRFYASLAGVGPAEFFKVEEAAKATPKVEF